MSIHGSGRTPLRRREVLVGGALLAAWPVLQPRLSAAQAGSSEGWTPFAPSMVRDLARELASRPYVAPDAELPGFLSALGYDEYRSIHFKPERAHWRGQGRDFEIQFFHRGFLFPQRIEIHEVADGRARRIAYDPAMFGSKDVDLEKVDGDIGFSGFRLHAPINRPDVLQEMLVFQGASYFRAVGEGQVYGISARGLSFRIADPAGEEFPIFRSFWIERSPDRGMALIHALLDSRSVTGAYRFEVRPGPATTTDVEAHLFPRSDLIDVGIAPLTSMYSFSPSDAQAPPDYRPSVHDSEGLEIRTVDGHQIWRPLTNPASDQLTRFAVDPSGFGLMQRRRSYRDFKDITARYEIRPSLWVEPTRPWGPGEIQLVELPTLGEYNDNIVAYWRPDEPLRAGSEYPLSYRLHWGWDAPHPSPLARFTDTLSGASIHAGQRYFALDATGGPLEGLDPGAEVSFSVSARGGQVVHPGVEFNPVTGGRRLAFSIVPDGSGAVEIEAVITSKGLPLSETWMYRWLPEN